MKPRTLLFLDVDGVLSIPPEPYRDYEYVGRAPCWPIPTIWQVLPRIEADRTLTPLWLTAWGEMAWEWNDRAGTSRWPFVYRWHNPTARRLFPQEWSSSALQRVDWAADAKRIAVRYYLRAKPNNPVVWVEDGFGGETYLWAERRGNVTLVDMTVRWIKSALLSEDAEQVFALLSGRSAALSSLSDA